MNKPIAHNIPISDLMNALTDMMSKGNRYVDVEIDSDFVLRLKGIKSLGQNRKRKSDESINSGGIPPLPNDINLMDLI